MKVRKTFKEVMRNEVLIIESTVQLSGLRLSFNVKCQLKTIYK